MTPTITQQAEKVAAELVTYLAKATAQNPAATQDENLATAMKMWLTDSIKMAGLAQDEQFCNYVFNATN
jgi:hypothetical protein